MKMTKAERVRSHRLCIKQSLESYYQMMNATDQRILDVFDRILDIMEQNTKELILTDLLLFESKTLDVKEYSIHEDGFYHYDKRIIKFEQKVNVELWMVELKHYIDKQDGYYAKRYPYQRYYNEPMTHYLQIGIE